MRDEPAMALFMGRALVMVAVNDAYRAFAPNPPIGCPVIEGYPDVSWRHVQRVMHLVYRMGEPRLIEWPTGPLWVIPYVAPDGRRGIVTHYQPIAPTLSLLPAEELALLA